jgi:hypothetical protein
MPSLWIGNFSFEDQLAGRQNQSAVVRRFEAELTPCLAAASSSGDYVLCAEEVDDEYLEKLEEIEIVSPVFITPEKIPELQGEITQVCPWGWTDQTRDLAKELGIQDESPSHEAVLLTNSRSYSLMLSRKLNCELPGEVEIHSMSELGRALEQAEFADGFVIKSEFSQSGRGQIMSRECVLSEKEHGWANKRFENRLTLYLEPKLLPVNEFGIQWEIPQQGTPALFGITALSSGRNGQFESSTVNIRFNLFPELEGIIEIQKEACSEIQRIGYFGPVGIDAMIYEAPDGKRMPRPLQDINARWTMGRLAICWANVCFPGKKHVTWSHGNKRPSPNAVPTSPQIIGGQPVRHQTWCEV